MKISDALGVKSSALWDEGAFDAYIGIDSRLHLDPALLRTTEIPEFRNSLKRFLKYFNDVLLLTAEAKPGGTLERQAIDKLVFPEIPAAALGFSTESDRGRGVSKKLASQLYSTVKEIVTAGIREPAIFELAIVFQEKFGPDLISDMTLQVIRDDLSAFNTRVCKSLKIPLGGLDINGKRVAAAYSKRQDRSVLLLPHELLATLPEASSYDDIDRIVRYNDQVRAQLNALLGENWGQLVRDMGKRQIRELLIKRPDVLRELIEQYKQARPEPYDFNDDPLGEVIWEHLGTSFATDNRLKLLKVSTPADLPRTIQLITTQFKRLVEINGLSDHLYSDSGRQRPEKFAQLLFYAVADSYCKANNLDLSAEPNAGRGPVDFKLSRGYNVRGTVELKLSSNSKALEGFLVQLPEYALAEQSVFDCFMIVVVGKSRAKVDAIVHARNKLLKARKTVPHLVIVNAFDAYQTPSASKLWEPPSWRN